MMIEPAQEQIPILTPDEFRDGILTLEQSPFGTTVEHIVKHLYNLELPLDKTRKYDLYDPEEGKRIEVKGCRPFLNAKTTNVRADALTMLTMIDGALKVLRREVPKVEDATLSPYLYQCALSSIYPDRFDVMYYGVFFSDVIAMFMIPSKDVVGLPVTTRRMAGKKDPCFTMTIRPNNYQWHLDNTHVDNLTYGHALAFFYQEIAEQQEKGKAA